MDAIINRIITEEINNTVFAKYKQRLTKLLTDLKTINLKQYGNEVEELGQDFNELGWSIVECLNGNSANAKGNNGKFNSNGINRMLFNQFSPSRQLRQFGINVPNEGLIDDALSTGINTYLKMRNKYGFGSDKNQLNGNNQQNVKGNLKKIMDTFWPQLYQRYANLYSKYNAMKNLPTINMLAQTLQDLKNTLK